MTQEEINAICDSMREFFRMSDKEAILHTGKLFSACLAVLAFNDNPSLEPGLPVELVEKVRKAVTGITQAAEPSQLTLKPVIVGLGWFAGSSADDRKKRMDNYLANEYGLCGCGKPVRYFTSDKSVGACNRYAQCPTYDDLLQQIKELKQGGN